MARNMIDDAADVVITTWTTIEGTREAAVAALVKTYEREAAKEYSMGNDSHAARYITFRDAILRAA